MNQLELQKLELELNSKATLLQEKEKLFNDARIDSQRLSAEVAYKEDALNKLNKQLAISQASLDETLAGLRGTISKETKVLKETETKTLHLVSACEELEKNKTVKTVQLQDIDSCIAERKTYLEQQELLIEESVATANSKLLGLKDEIADKEQLIKSLDAVIKERDRDIAAMNNQCDLLQTEIQSKEDDFSVREQSLLIQLDDLKHQIKDNESRRDAVSEETADKLRQLKQYETSLMVKTDALKLAQQELQTEKRRFNSAQSLYNQ